MNTFFKVFFACLLAIFIAGLLMFMMLIGMAGLFAGSDKPIVQQKTILYLDLSEPLMEQGREEDINLNNFNLEKVMGLQDVIAGLMHARSDSSIKGLYLLCRGNSLGFAASQELGEAIEAFRQSGKPVVAYADAMPQRAYEIAHRASHVYVQPGSVVEWVGYHIEVLFFKNLLDKLAVKPEIFYAGQFKSATEPFRLTKMSDPNRLQYQDYLRSIYSSLMASVQKHRGLDSATLTRLANNLEVRTTEQAVENGLIDGAIYDDEIRDTLRHIAGIKPGEDIRLMQMGDYIEASRKAGTGDRVAVVYADGDIVGGAGEDDEIGADNFRALLTRLRKEKRVKAVVLRVNSPGGSAIASELIWRELRLLKKEKPLVISMGNYAASGGYYISCIGDSIFALPNTLTGSIGVFSLYVDAQKLFSDKLGITFDGVSTNTYSDFGSITRPMSAFERQVAQRDVDSVYEMFKERVVRGRNLNATVVEAIAQGRVWSGTDALQLGLVDRLGTLQDAIACAAKLAGMEKYQVKGYPERKSLLDRLIGDKEDPNTTEIRQLAKALSPSQVNLVRQYRTLEKMAETPQARLPFIIQLPEK